MATEKDFMDARTALGFLQAAWDAAHPVKKGDVIPEGDVFLSGSRDYFTCEKAYRDTPVGPSGANWVRTLDPLSEPEPDWLDAPAVLASLDEPSSPFPKDTLLVWAPCRKANHAEEAQWAVSGIEACVSWRDLRDVTPLYPKEMK